jgi:hypothetical protein
VKTAAVIVLGLAGSAWVAAAVAARSIRNTIDPEALHQMVEEMFG